MQKFNLIILLIGIFEFTGNIGAAENKSGGVQASSPYFCSSKNASTLNLVLALVTPKKAHAVCGLPGDICLISKPSYCCSGFCFAGNCQ